jgi:hypothetical protein
MTDDAATPAEISDTEAKREAFERRRLSRQTYQQRRAMLLMAAATFAVVIGGFDIAGINAFGFKIEKVRELELLAFM